MAENCPDHRGPNPVVVTPASPMENAGPQDVIPRGDTIGTGFSGYIQSFDLAGCDSINLNVSYVAPVKFPVSGVTYIDGKLDYEVFEMGVQAIGYFVGIRGAKADHFVSMNNPRIQTYPAPVTSTGGQLWASMADATNPANTSDTSSLTLDSSSGGLSETFYIDNSAGDGVSIPAKRTIHF